MGGGGRGRTQPDLPGGLKVLKWMSCGGPANSSNHSDMFQLWHQTDLSFNSVLPLVSV